MLRGTLLISEPTVYSVGYWVYKKILKKECLEYRVMNSGLMWHDKAKIQV